MLTPILTILRQPASRRKWLTIISGSLIVLGLIALDEVERPAPTASKC